MTNRLLAIDTSSPRCGAAILVNDQIISRSSDRDRQAAQLILPMIEELVDETGNALDEIEGIAVAAGPGSFTGIRIGIGIAQGLGMSLSKPVLALSNLAVMAMAAITTRNCNNVLVSMKARNCEVYFAAYYASVSAGVVLLGQEQVCTAKEIGSLPPLQGEVRNWLGVGDGWNQEDEILQALQLGAENFQLGEDRLNSELDIRALCELAKLRLQLGEGVAAEQVLPNYIKVELGYR